MTPERRAGPGARDQAPRVRDVLAGAAYSGARIAERLGVDDMRALDQVAGPTAGDVDGAWSVAVDGGWDPGERRWRRLAEAERLGLLRERHRRRPTLISMLDKAGLR